MHPFSFTGADIVPLAMTRAVPMATAMSNDAIAVRRVDLRRQNGEIHVANRSVV
jgi:hypothetical protein